MEGTPRTLPVTRRIPPLVGLLNRALVRVPFAGEIVAARTAGMVGRLLPHASFLGFRPGNSYGDAVANWENFLMRIGAAYVKETDGPDSATYTFQKCPAGFSCSRHLKACKATMELDHGLVEASGATLTVEKRIPADCVCVERISAK